MGMSFDLDSKDGTRVTEVAPGSPAMTAGVEAGDGLIAVGGESILGLDVKKGIKKIVKSNWPRKLRFKVPEQRKEEEGGTEEEEEEIVRGVGAGSQKIGSSFVLHVVSPYALHGSYGLPSSSWGGGESGEIPCGPPGDGRLLTLNIPGSDINLCQYDLTKMEEGRTWQASDIVFARRGVCGMVDKAKYASHGGAGAMVLVNNKPKALSEIPKGPVSTNDIRKRGTGVFSVGGIYGNMLTEALLSVPK